jgi:peptidoglycan/LPS O-acetylase OafA/YrhL
LVVVAFHVGLARAAGGFIGVDIFFVLSGFLITGLLVREAKGTGKISLVGFWFRRARRLVPAALLTIVVSAVLFSFLSSVPERTAALTDGQAATLWYANWHFIGQAQDYFAAEIDTSPFLHFWSLSIEEQFYAVWPLMVFAAVSVRWIRQALGNTWVIVAVPLVAAMYAMLRAASDPTRSQPIRVFTNCLRVQL